MLLPQPPVPPLCKLGLGAGGAGSAAAQTKSLDLADAARPARRVRYNRTAGGRAGKRVGGESHQEAAVALGACASRFAWWRGGEGRGVRPEGRGVST